MITRGQCLTRLFEAFDKKATTGMLYYYEEWAKSLSVEDVSKIVDQAVKSCDYCPTVKKLYELTILDDTTRATMQQNVYFCEECNVGFSAKDGKCPTCGSQGL